MEGNSIKTFENLCKIFEMRIKLDSIKGEDVSEEVLENYEKYAKKIDSYYNEEFQKELKNLITPKKTLDKERERLEKLIDLLEDRLKKRSSLAGDFHAATGKYIKNLQLIVSENELNNKKERLNLISKYLDTVKEIENIKENIEKLRETLSEEEEKKDDYFEKNKALEDELYSSFVTSVSSDEYYGSIEEENIINILEEVSKKAKDNKETLDITKESVESLLSTGMDDEYTSYIEEASKSYSLWKDREIILKIYKLVINFEDEFKDILAKRDEITRLFEERKTINVDTDILIPFEDVMLNQSKILNNEKEILDNIANLTSRIEFKEERLEELEEVIKEPEILAILSEYNLIDETKEQEDKLESNSLLSVDIPVTDGVSVKEYNPYSIISIDDSPLTLNVGLAKLKGTSVRDKVKKKLNIELGNAMELDNNIVSDVNDIQNVVQEKPHTDETNIVNEQVINSLSDEIITNNGENSNTEVEKESSDGSKMREKDGDSKNEEGSSFWIPVSDSKLEASDFPNINIPIHNDNLKDGNDNFGFPEVNN